MSDLPEAETADTDGVQVALRAAHTLWSRGDTTESLRWLRRAAESASDEGADIRSLQLAKAAAELRSKLFSSSDEVGSPRPAASGETSGAQAQPAAPEQDEAARQVVGSSGPASGPPSSSPPSSEPTRSSWSDENTGPGSVRPVVTATQYPTHRPRQLMGLSSTTLETAVQREGSTYSGSWSADAERRISSAPPPLPRAAVDDYEELEAEPDEDEDSESGTPAWAPESWRTRSAPSSRPESLPESGRGMPAAAPVPAPTVSSPPPLPRSASFVEGGEQIRAEQATGVMPPEAAEGGDSGRIDPGRADPSRVASPFTNAASSWDSGERSSGWQSDASFSWESELRATGWNGASSADAGDGVTSSSESSPPKLTARVHHQAVRVSFAPDPRVPGQYLVRALREGERAAVGERIALLVALEPGQPLV